MYKCRMYVDVGRRKLRGGYDVLLMVEKEIALKFPFDSERCDKRRYKWIHICGLSYSFTFQ